MLVQKQRVRVYLNIPQFIHSVQLVRASSRNLLHHIMSGKEFEIKVEQSTYSVVVEHKDMATKKLVAEAKSIMEQVSVDSSRSSSH